MAEWLNDTPVFNKAFNERKPAYLVRIVRIVADEFRLAAVEIDIKLGLSKNSNFFLPFREEGKWKPCEIAPSFGSPVHFKALAQTSPTKGERFLDQRFELLPDACLAARGSGNLVAVFSNDRDYSVILHSRNLGRAKLPASIQ